MCREVVHIQVGQCGNQIGTKFWETIAQEHGLAPDGTYCGDNPVQLEKINVFYHETGSGQFVPRGVLVDMENTVLNHITSRTYGRMFRPENFLSTTEGAANNYMVGRYSKDANELCERSFNIIRKELERTECCQGFSVSHSAAGGTGSGLTMNIIEKCTNDKNKLLAPTFGGIFFYTVFPSTKISNTIVEPYNACMTVRSQKTKENVVCFDNESLYRICLETLGIDTPTFGDLNRLISMVMSGTTASFRFPGQINTDMNKLSYSLRARGFLHYYVPSFAPLTALKNQPFQKLTVSELVRQMIDEKNYMIDISTAPQDKPGDKEPSIDGKIFSYAALFRGNMTTAQVDNALVFLRGENNEHENLLRKHLGWKIRSNSLLEPLWQKRDHFKVHSKQNYILRNPRPCFNTITGYAPPAMPMSVTYLCNTTQIKMKFLKICREAKKMLNVGAYLHWFEDPYKTQDVTRITEVVNELTADWIGEFGTEDGTNWPEAFSDTSDFWNDAALYGITDDAAKAD